ncbi:MAG: MFS transporter [Simkania sp.]|nr:MFS transporter [Simkania sp.]
MKRSSILLLLLFFLVTSETVDVNLIHLSSVSINPNYIIYPLSILQIVFATVQAGLSDYYSRKKSILFGFVIILISLCFFVLSYWKYKLFFISLFIVFLGVGGNVMPMALAALGDLTHAKNFRFILSIAIAAIALGSFGPLHLDNYLSDSSAFILTVIIVSSACILCSLLPKKTTHSTSEKFSIKTECSTIYQKFLKNKTFLLALFGFFFVETSFYQIFLRDEAGTNHSFFRYIPIKFGIAYFIGTAALKYSRASDIKNVIRGFWISFISVGFLSILYFFGLVESWLVWISMIGAMGYAYGYALFTPSLFSFVSKYHSSHDYGKIFGLIDSTDTLALISAFSIINFTKHISINSIYLLSTSIIIIAGVMFFMLNKGNHAKEQTM